MVPFAICEQNPPSNLSILEGLATWIGSHLTRESTASPVLTKWWKSELMLATNLGSLCPKVTKVGSQNFGYQIWFCTRLIMTTCSDQWWQSWHLITPVFQWCLETTNKRMWAYRWLFSELIISVSGDGLLLVLHKATAYGEICIKM